MLGVFKYKSKKYSYAHMLRWSCGQAETIENGLKYISAKKNVGQRFKFQLIYKIFGYI